MQGRLGGRIGVSSSPAFGGTSGVWRLADVYAAKVGAYGYMDNMYGPPPPLWPTRTLTIAWQSDNFADATATGSATFTADVTSEPNLAFSYYWERSTDAGSTWATVSGSSGSSTTNDDGYGTGMATVTLNLTGQTIANDENRYRLVVVVGLKTYTGPTGTLWFDTVTLSAGGGLTSNFNNYFTSLTVSAGSSFAYNTTGGFLNVKYSNPQGGYAPASIAIQRSGDGGATWQSQTPDYADSQSAGKNYTASASDNGAKWRGAFQFQGQTYYGPVSTLTVT